MGLAEGLKGALHNAYQNIVLAGPFDAERAYAAEETRAFVRAWNYLHRAKVRGDYLEFGVYQGTSFSLALKACAKFFKKSDDDAPAFYAFDSFEGLPEVNPQMNGEMFEKGEYRASRKSFESRIRSPARGWKVGVVAGLFCHSLKDAEEVIREQGIKLTAFINVDCDLYESTVDVLKFITPLVQTGTVLFFDDWYFTGGDMQRGEARATGEWLKANPHITLVDWGDVAVMGKMFLVQVGGQGEEAEGAWEFGGPKGTGQKGTGPKGTVTLTRTLRRGSSALRLLCRPAFPPL